MKLFFIITDEIARSLIFALNLDLLFLKRTTINCPFCFVASKKPFIFRFAPEKVSQLIERQVKKTNIAMKSSYGTICQMCQESKRE